MCRGILLDAGARLGFATASIFWDVEAFFDSFSVGDAIAVAGRLRYPQRLLLLGLQLHTSSRLLTAGGSTVALEGISEGGLGGVPAEHGLREAHHL